MQEEAAALLTLKLIRAIIKNNSNYQKHRFFYKGKYHQGLDPFTDPYLDEVLNNEKSKNYCTWYYANKLDELRKKYKINY